MKTVFKLRGYKNEYEYTGPSSVFEILYYVIEPDLNKNELKNYDDYVIEILDAAEKPLQQILLEGVVDDELDSFDIETRRNLDLGRHYAMIFLLQKQGELEIYEKEAVWDLHNLRNPYNLSNRYDELIADNDKKIEDLFANPDLLPY